MNKDLTIILLLKGRDAFTLRWFEYAKKTKLPYHVIVADGGNETGLEAELLNKQFHLDVSYEYVRYPYDKSHQLFYQKTLSALHKVQTPFVVLASNDDFYFFDALDYSISFLKENNDYVSSRGEIWDFSISSTLNYDGLFKKNEIYGRLNNLYKLYRDPSVVGESAMCRAIDFSSKRNSIWHDVVRTESIKESYVELVGVGVDDLNLADSLVNFLLATKGKIHRGSDLYMLHQCHEDMTASVICYESPLDWIGVVGWNSDFNKLLDVVARQISDIDQVPFYEAKYKLLKTYYDSILLKDIRNHLLFVREKEMSKYKLTNIAKEVLRGNRVTSILLKMIKGLFDARKPNHQIPSSFVHKITFIQKFLGKSTA